MAIRVAQVVAENVLEQAGDIRIAQVVAENVILQDPAIRVAQVVWESVILPGVPVPASTQFAPIGGGGGCLPHCLPICPPTSVETMRAQNRGGDPAILLALLAALIVAEEL